MQCLPPSLSHLWQSREEQGYFCVESRFLDFDVTFFLTPSDILLHALLWFGTIMTVSGWHSRHSTRWVSCGRMWNRRSSVKLWQWPLTREEEKGAIFRAPIKKQDRKTTECAMAPSPSFKGLERHRAGTGEMQWWVAQCQTWKHRLSFWKVPWFQQ